MSKGLPVRSSDDMFSIEMSSFTIKLRTFDLSSNNYIQQKNESDGTGGSLWRAGLAFAKYIDLHPEIVKDKIIIELGAGIGLVGITAMILGAKQVILTDLKNQENIINYNINLNNDKYDKNKIPFFW